MDLATEKVIEAATKVYWIMVYASHCDRSCRGEIPATQIAILTDATANAFKARLFEIGNKKYCDCCIPSREACEAMNFPEGCYHAHTAA